MTKKPYLKLFLIQVGIIVALIGLGILFFTIKNGGIDKAFEYFFSYAMSDYGQYIFFTVQKNPFVSSFHTMYTPLNFLLMMPFTFFLQGNEIFYRLGSVTVEEYNIAVVTSGAFWISYVPYVFSFIGFYVVLLRKIMPKQIEDKAWLALALVFSNLGIYAISRGSNVMQVMLLLELFVWLYRSEKPWQKEIALLCLAAAGVCKYYPFIFGALLIKRKDYLAVLRVALYSIPLFFLPFLCYEGGFENLAIYFGNLGEFVYGEGRLSADNNLSVYSLVYKIGILFGGDGTDALKIISLISCGIVLVITAILSIRANDLFSQYVLFNVAMTLVCPVSYYYLVIFLVFPIVEFVGDYETFTKGRKIYYLVFFSLCSFLPSLLLRPYILQTLLYLGAIVVEWIHITKKTEQKERT